MSKSKTLKNNALQRAAKNVIQDKRSHKERGKDIAMEFMREFGLFSADYNPNNNNETPDLQTLENGSIKFIKVELRKSHDWTFINTTPFIMFPNFTPSAIFFQIDTSYPLCQIVIKKDGDELFVIGKDVFRRACNSRPKESLVGVHYMEADHYKKIAGEWTKFRHRKPREHQKHRLLDMNFEDFE